MCFAFTPQSFISDCRVSSFSLMLLFLYLCCSIRSCLTQSLLDCLDIVFKSVVPVALSTLLRARDFLPAIASLTASSPKQRRAWCFRFAVDALSFESWKRRMPPACTLHLAAAQVKKWQGRLSWYWKVTSGLMSGYAGDTGTAILGRDGYKGKR